MLKLRSIHALTQYDHAHMIMLSYDHVLTQYDIFLAALTTLTTSTSIIRNRFPQLKNIKQEAADSRHVCPVVLA